MAMKTNFSTINLWTTQSSLYSHEAWGGVWVVIAISSIDSTYAKTHFPELLLNHIHTGVGGGAESAPLMFFSITPKCHEILKITF